MTKRLTDAACNCKTASWRVKAYAFTRQLAGEGVRLHPYRTPRRHCHHRHIGGNAPAGTLGSARTRKSVQLYR